MLLCIASLVWVVLSMSVSTLQLNNTSTFHAYLDKSLILSHHIASRKITSMKRYVGELNGYFLYRWHMCISKQKNTVAAQTSFMILRYLCYWSSTAVGQTREISYMIQALKMFQINTRFTTFILYRSFSGCVYHAVWVNTINV